MKLSLGVGAIALGAAASLFGFAGGAGAATLPVGDPLTITVGPSLPLLGSSIISLPESVGEEIGLPSIAAPVLDIQNGQGQAYEGQTEIIENGQLLHLDTTQLSPAAATALSDLAAHVYDLEIISVSSAGADIYLNVSVSEYSQANGNVAPNPISDSLTIPFKV
jgi:hypothetical protein